MLNAEISLLCGTLPTFRNSKLSAQLSSAQNVERKVLQKSSASANFLAERERSQLYERTKALLL